MNSAVYRREHAVFSVQQFIPRRELLRLLPSRAAHFKSSVLLRRDFNFSYPRSRVLFKNLLERIHRQFCRWQFDQAKQIDDMARQWAEYSAVTVPSKQVNLNGVGMR
ncbi:hypothetical protein [Anatilimnocola floriformis]|uniref:hypothetical protein n=1 Tax=Anatilimnocola floriformis TaxID=2948575 RepID=UPI0020C58DAF|nr:hypothetical protein [Anatilimnocola floriformis]